MTFNKDQTKQTQKQKINNNNPNHWKSTSSPSKTRKNNENPKYEWSNEGGLGGGDTATWKPDIRDIGETNINMNLITECFKVLKERLGCVKAKDS